MLALEGNKLVPLRIDITLPPLGFRSIHTIDLTAWTGETDAEPFERLVKDLGYYLGPPPSPLLTKAILPMPPPSMGDAAAARVAYDRCDYATALRLAQPAAERGDHGAQHILGKLHETGRGVAQDYAEAAR